MKTQKSDLVAVRFRQALDLFEVAEGMMRQNLRRKDAEASDEDIDARLTAWVCRRPGAEHGDGVGRPGAWPRDRS